MHTGDVMDSHALSPTLPQIGTVIRIFLGLLLGGNCGQVSWAPCVTSAGQAHGGALFKDLPANLLGCFLMGLFVSSEVCRSDMTGVRVQVPCRLVAARCQHQQTANM